MTTRPLFRATALVLSAALSLSACSNMFTRDSAPTTTRSDFAEGYGPPLPADATVEPAGVAPIGMDTENIIGSLRPDDTPPEEAIPDIVDRGRLIVGVDQSQYLLSYRDSVTGELRGFEIDLAREIARDIFGDPNQIEFRFVDSSDRIATLNNNEVDIVVRTMSVTQARQEDVLFSTPYLATDTRLLVMNNSGIDSFADLPGQTVCVTDSSTSLDTAREHAPHSPLLRVRNWADCLVALQQHQAEAIASDGFILSGITAQDPYTEIVGEAFEEAEYAVAAAHPRQGYDSEGMIRQVNSTLERILSDGTWWRMYDRWFSAYLATSGPPELFYREEEQ